MCVLCAKTAEPLGRRGKYESQRIFVPPDLWDNRNNQLCLQRCCEAMCRASGAGMVFLPLGREPPACYTGSKGYHHCKSRGENATTQAHSSLGHLGHKKGSPARTGMNLLLHSSRLPPIYTSHPYVHITEGARMSSVGRQRAC